MADPVAPAPVVTPAPAAPAVEAVAPVAVAPAAPAPAPAPVEAAAPAAPAPAAPAAVEAPTSILSEAQPVKPVEPAVASPPPPATPAEVVAPVTPLPPPSYESFKLPEGVTLDQTRVGEFTKMLGEFEVANKADHAQMQAFGQRMVDIFVAEQQRSTQALVDQFTETRKQWVDQIKADATFGGNNFNQTVAAAGSLIEQYGGSADEVKELRHALRITGMGDHPALIRMLARVGKSVAQEGKPVPASVPKNPTAVPKSQRRYPTLANGNGA